LNEPNENAKSILCKRYYHRGAGHEGEACEWGTLHCPGNHESHDEFLHRASLYNYKYYTSLIAPGYFLPNSPTLFNLPCRVCDETEVHGTLSACFKFDIPDTMDGILEVHRLSALVQKWGGGVGFYLGLLRPEGSLISTTHAAACGPVRVIKHLHSLGLNLITQGGRRPAAQMAILPASHPDIEQFIHLKDNNPELLSTFNLSVSITDEDIEERPYLLRAMAESAWQSGDPGCYFVDRAEANNPTPEFGELSGTNPCGEAPLLDRESCNLGSINLVLVPPTLRGAVARLCTEYLDDIQDINRFPDPSIAEAVQRTRKLGLGVMGWADHLAQQEIHYDSDEALDEAVKVMGEIQAASHAVSIERGEIHGTVGTTGRRNATCTSVAPTGSISLLAGVSSGIEPHFAHEWDRIMADGTVLKESAKSGVFVPQVSHDIPWEAHVEMQSAFQSVTDMAVSKTINMNESATVEQIEQAYARMWQKGCTGGTIYRDKSREIQVLNTGG